MAGRPAALALGVLAAASCARQDLPTPVLVSVEPGAGYVGLSTPVVVRGRELAVRVEQASRGGAPRVDSRYRAWLGDAASCAAPPGCSQDPAPCPAELPVGWIDPQTLEATVPRCLPGGAHPLVVEDPFGGRARLDAAFVVSLSAAGALASTVAAEPGTASVGQRIALVATVRNTGAGAVTGVAPASPSLVSADGAAASLVNGPVPASIASLAPGETGTFRWDYAGVARGHLDLSVAVAGTDGFSGTTVVASPGTPCAVVLQTPPALSVTLAPAASAPLDGTIPVTMTVTNEGDADASTVEPTDLSLTSGSLPLTLLDGPAPSQATIPGVGSAPLNQAIFTWTWSAGSVQGTAAFLGGATGVDATSLAPVAAAPVVSSTVTVGRSDLAATLRVDPPVVSLGQLVTLTLEVGNPGSAPLAGVGPGAVFGAGSGAASPVSGPAPATIDALAPGETRSFAWTYRAEAAGVLSFSTSVSGTDSYSGTRIATGAVVSDVLTLETPAALAPTLTASAATASTGQAVTLTLALTNGGTAGASVTAVTPASTPASGASCTAASPAPPRTVAGGATVTFTWTCTATTAGARTYGATVTATDVNSGASIAPAVTAAAVTVQAAAVLAPTLTVSAATASTGQAVTLTLALRNDGAAGASVAAVTPTASPALDASCTAASPSPPQPIGGGATRSFTWTCTATSPGTYTYGATVAAADANSGANLAPTVTGAVVAVQSLAALVPTLTASAAIASTGQAVTLTLALTSVGAAGASVAAVTPTTSPAADASCTAARPVPPQTIAGGATQSFTWTCTATAAGTYTYGALVAAADANSGAAVGPTVESAAVTVQAAAVLAPTVTASAAIASSGQAVTLTLALRNDGSAGATVAAVTPTANPAADASCTAASPPPPQAIAGGATLSFTWTCAATAAGIRAYGATVTAADANSGASIAPTVTGAVVTVQAAAALSGSVSADLATVNTGQAVMLTMTVDNTGQAAATATAATPGAGGTAAAACTAPSPVAQTIAGGGSATFTWSCTPSTTGSLALGAGVGGTDANSGTAVTAVATAARVTVQSPAALAATVAVAGSPVVASTGQALPVTLTVTNTGTASATVTGASPSTSGPAATCTAATPSTLAIAGGSAGTFTWSCTALEAGTLQLGGGVAGADATSGVPLVATASPQAGVLIQAAASLWASVSASAATASTGQSVTLTLTVENGGQAASSATTPTVLDPAGATGCGAPSPASRVIAGGGSGTFTWSCTVAATGPLVFGASVSGTDANSGATVGPVTATTATVTGQAPAALSVATFGVSPATVGTGQPATVALTLANTGGASAVVSGVAPRITPAANSGCGQASPAVPQTVAGGGSVTFTWTCGATSEGSYNLDATIGATDANSGASVAPNPAVIPLEVRLPVGAPVAASEPGSSAAATSVASSVDRSGTSAPASGAWSAGVELVGSDPLGDGTAQALLTGWQGSVWVGPGRDGARLARVDPGGSGTRSYGVSLAVDGGATPASNTSWATWPTASTLGSPGCAAETTGCGPDDEAGAGLLASGVLGGADWLWVAGSGPRGTRYLYAASAFADPLGLAFVDVRDALQAGGTSGQAPLLSAVLPDAGPSERLYLGYARGGPDGGPLLLALGALPRGQGLDALVGPDVLDLQAAALPGAAGAGITALASFGGLVYVGHEAGIVRATVALPGPAGGSPGDWAAATPTAPAWAAKAPVPLPASGSAARRDRAVPAFAAFGGCGPAPCLFAARNVQGAPWQPAVVPQLWRCDADAGPAPCAPGRWRLAAANADGDPLLSQLGDAANGALTVLAATPRWLYVGFDNAATGVQLYRAAAAPVVAGDFQGEGDCTAGEPGCQGLGGNGFGDATVTRVLDFRVLDVGGVTSLWMVAGDGAGPARVYRISD